MKKHLIILFLLISMFGYSQTFTTYQRWKRVTTTEKLAIPVNDPTVVYEVFDTTLGRYETYNHETEAWEPSAELPPLKAVDEGDGVGYRLRSINPDKVGNIGVYSIDFGSYNASPNSTTAGPTGSYNFTAIGNNTLSGDGNTAFGSFLTATSAYNFVTGYSNTINGNVSSSGGNLVAGRGNVLGGGLGNMLLGNALYQPAGIGVVVLGTANAEVPTTNNFNSSNPVFIVGNGTHSTSSGADWSTGATRSNLLVGYRSGLIVAPSLTKTLIDADTTGRALVTKEWVLTAIDTISGGGGAVSSVNSQTGDVVIDPDDLDDTSTTNKFVTATEKGLIATALQPSRISNEVYNATTWDSATPGDAAETTAPSKNAIRDKIETLATLNTLQSFTAPKRFTNSLIITADGTNTGDRIEFEGNNNSAPEGNPTIGVYQNKMYFTFDKFTPSSPTVGYRASFTGNKDFTGNRTFTFPNKSGTIALLDDISGSGGGSTVSDEAYNAATWNGVDSIAPSKNAVRDKFNDIDLTLANVVTTNTNQTISGTKTMTGGFIILADGESYSDAVVFQGNINPSVTDFTGVNIFRQNDKLGFTLDAGLNNKFLFFTGTGNFTVPRTVTWQDKDGTVAYLSDIPDGVSNEAADISVDTSEFTNNLTVADSTVQKALKTLDGLSIGVNTAFRTVTSTSGVFTESYDSDQPNFQLTLDEDVEVEITDAVNGDFLIAEIVNPEDEPFLVTFIGSDKEYLIEGGETAVFSMITNADDETIWIKSILEDTASTYKEVSETGAVAIDFKNYDFIKLNVEDENYLEFINPRKNVANLTLHLENREGIPYDIHFPENTLFKTLGQGPTIELGSDKLGVFKFDYRDGGYICTSYDVDYDIPVVHTYTIVRRVNTGSTSDITATDGEVNWQNGFSGGPGGPFNNLQVTTGNNLATTSTTWTRHGSIPSSMPDADFQTLFDSERWDESSGSEMKYTFSSMTAGTYKVRIYMGESNNTATVGTRVFDIKIQGNTVDTVDIVDRFGDNEVAGMVEYDNIIVSGTTLDVEWIHVTENPVVNGIEILKRD